MQYGICHLSVVSVRLSSDNTSEMTTQLLFGDHFKVLEQQKKCSKIRIAYDGFEGWIDNNQYHSISETEYHDAENKAEHLWVTDLVTYAQKKDHALVPLILGSALHHNALLTYNCDNNDQSFPKVKTQLVKTALLYLNAPFLRGGKTPFGVDAAGFTQMVYKISGYQLFRTALQQSAQGEALSFIEESEAGDLAFFDNKDGIIDHVGIIMENNYIIHAHGKVRIDRIDHTGIFSAEANNYTHKLRVIKKIV